MSDNKIQLRKITDSETLKQFPLRKNEKGEIEYPYVNRQGEVQYASDEAFAGAIDWRLEQDVKGKEYDFQDWKAGKGTSYGDRVDPWIVKMAQESSDLPTFEKNLTVSGRQIVKFPSDDAQYKKYREEKARERSPVKELTPKPKTVFDIVSPSLYNIPYKKEMQKTNTTLSNLLGL